MKTKVFIVNHTHWDREWYKTKDQYLLHLKAGIEYLVDQFAKKRIEYFYFDGQTIIIDDLKQVLAKSVYDIFIGLIKTKKIEVGPWFVLPDEGLIDEIGFCKNLEIGTEICQNLGVKHSNVLYMPDTFGHNNKMPSIAKKFGLKNAIIHRGLTTNQVDCMWTDGESRIKTIVLPTREGYYQTMFHHDNYSELFEKYVEAFQGGDSDADVLVLNGCDHTFIPFDFKEKLDSLKEKYHDQYEFCEVTLSEFFKQTKYKFEHEISGEFRNASKAFLLPGVLSTRYYLKRDNREVTDLLKYFYEPIAHNLRKREKENVNINNLWKKVIENHPHDSICGCSIDPVHREMELRTKQIKDNCETAIYELFNSNFEFKIESNSQNNSLTNDQIVIFNHLESRNHITKLNIKIPLDILLCSEEIKANVNNIENVELPDITLCLKSTDTIFGVDIKKITTKEVLIHDYHSEPTYTFIVEVELYANLYLENGINHFSICLETTADQKEVKKIAVSKTGVVSIGDKEINLIDYRYISDRGDSYNFDPVGEYQKIMLDNYERVNGLFFDKHIFVSKAIVGKSLDEVRQKRTNDLQELIIRTEVYSFDDKIKVSVAIDNHHKDIKLVKGYATTDSLYSNVTLDTLKRTQIENITYDAVNVNNEIQYNQHPTLSEILLDSKVQISHLGNNEVEIIDDLVLHTLFRATGDLSRRDLISRRGGAGPSYSAPDCQCQRAINFDFLLTASEKLINNQHLELYSFKYHQFCVNKK